MAIIKFIRNNIIKNGIILKKIKFDKKTTFLEWGNVYNESDIF